MWVIYDPENGYNSPYRRLLRVKTYAQRSLFFFLLFFPPPQEFIGANYFGLTRKLTRNFPTLIFSEEGRKSDFYVLLRAPFLKDRGYLRRGSGGGVRREKEERFLNVMERQFRAFITLPYRIRQRI